MHPNICLSRVAKWDAIPYTVTIRLLQKNDKYIGNLPIAF